ncbi:DUF1203 domain-containing protein [Leeia sp.]|uniref:DUF1203 domain-containing protein n=1 Tax=Leeia sp. TaxID=2884678 RepID=UPI0035B2C9E3
MSFRIRGLLAAPFEHLLSLSDAALKAQGIQRLIIREPDSAPCRISLQDAMVDESVLLLNHAHHASSSPYAASGPIFIRESARETFDALNQVPRALRLRLLSVRAYTAHGDMLDADVCEGAQLETLISRFFQQADAQFLHVHHARRGCYACRIDRA